MDHIEQGYVITRSLFSDVECDNLIAQLQEKPNERGRAGSRHLMGNPGVSAIAHDERLLEIARVFLGKSAVPYRATLFKKSSAANWLVVWHQDTALPLRVPNNSSEWGPWSRKGGILYAHAPAWALARIVALRIHLDASTAHNGPLRVIPGSHSMGVLPDEEVFAWARTNEHIPCIVPRGGVMAMRPLIIHSSSKLSTNSARRVLHIEYADSLNIDKDVCLDVA